MTTLVLIAALANAGSPSHYDPLEVTDRSERFRGAAASSGAILREREATATTVAANLRALELALDLLGPRAPAERYDRLEALQERYHREHAVVQAFVDTLSEDFEQVFSEALDRALAGVEGDPVHCPAHVTIGSSLPGMPKRTEPNPECEGEDLNDTLAAALDADPLLEGELEEIAALDWPEITVPSEARPAIGEGERAVYVPVLIDAVARDALLAIDRHDADARLEFEAAIEQSASKDELEAMLDDARALTAATAAARAELADPILSAARLALNRYARKREPKTAWCANPPAFGGCDLPDATDELVPRLAEDKRVRKAVPTD